MADKIFDEYHGTNIRIDGVCYQFIEETTAQANATSDEISGPYDSCTLCETLAPDFVAGFDGVNQYLLESSAPSVWYPSTVSTYCIAVEVTEDPLTRPQDMFLMACWGAATVDRIFSVSIRDDNGYPAIIVKNNANSSVFLEYPEQIVTEEFYTITAYIDTASNEIGIALNDNAYVTSSVTLGTYDNPAFVIGTYTANLDYSFAGKASLALKYDRLLTQAQYSELYNGGGLISYDQLSSLSEDLTTSLVAAAPLYESNAVFQDPINSETFTNVNSVTSETY